MKEIINNNKEWIDKTWEKVDNKLSKIAVRSRNKLPFTTIDGVHDNRAETDPAWWTNGFFGGLMWLMYIGTGNDEYKKTALRSEELLDVVLKDYDALHHDVGFMWHLLCGARYKITGEKDARNKNLYLASVLYSRFNTDGNYIIAWNNAVTCSIIDTLMNLSLLYWASEEVNDTRFKRVAMKQMDMAMRDHIREDGTVNHIVEHDVLTGEFLNSFGGQGYGEGSCWSRGLSWAVYGSVLSYIHAEKQEYLDTALKTADCYIKYCK